MSVELDRAVIAVIADIVGSRTLADRSRAQRTFTDVLARAGEGLDLPRPPYATVGDEFQALATDLSTALTLTLRTQLLLPEGLSLRFGVGAGEARDIDDGGTPRSLQDGSAWWRAREAVDEAHAAQDDGLDFVRTRVRLGREGDPEGQDEAVETMEAMANAMLTLRDQAVERLRERPRRVIAHLLMGATQVQAARAESVTQSAVSALVRGTGAGLLRSQMLIAPPAARFREEGR